MAALTEVLEDLCFRFIVNCPKEDLESFERLCFQIELAHWFYEDHYRELDNSLPGLGWKEFAKRIFRVCDLLQPYASKLDEIFERFRLYKSKVPAYGAILLNPAMTHTVLVKGWTARSSWGFPKGKVNKDEPEILCAQRECYEETSFDITGKANESEYIDAAIHEQRVRLFIVRNVPQDTVFAPRTKKEISKIEWHAIDSLPSSKNSSAHKNANHFFTVIPFVSKLRHWIKTQRSFDKRRITRSAPSAAPPAASHPINVIAALRPPQPHTPYTEAARAQAEAAIKALIRYGEESLHGPTAHGHSESSSNKPMTRQRSITVEELFALHKDANRPAAQAAVVMPSPSTADGYGGWSNFNFNREEIMAALDPLS